MAGGQEARGRVAGSRDLKARLARSLLGPPWPGAACFALLLLLAVAGPLLVWPAAVDSFVLPKFTLLSLVALAMAGVLLVGAALGEPMRLMLHPLNGLLALWFLWNLVSVLWAEPRDLAWDQVRQTGLWVLFAWGAQAALLDNRRRVLVLGAAVVATASIVAAWALVLDWRGAFGASVPEQFRRLADWREFPSRAGLGNTGHVADFLGLGFLVALATWLSAPGRAVRWLCAGALWLLAAGMVVCWSVHSNAGVIAGSVVLWALLRDWLPEDRLRARLRRGLPVLLAGWALVVAFFAVDHPLNPHGSAAWGAEGDSGGIFHQAFASERWKDGGPTRLAIWLGTLEVIRQNPVLGAGAGTFTWHYPAAITPLVSENPEIAMYSGSWTNAAHNTLLQTWSELGVPGMVLVVMIVGGAFLYQSRRRERGTFGNQVVLATASACLAAWVASSLMSFPLELPVSSAVLAVLVSVPVALARRGGEAEAMLMPANRDYPGVTLWVVFENMARLVEARLELRAPMAARWAVVALVATLVGVLAWNSTARLRADVLYRPVYADWSGRVPAPRPPERMADQARRALAVSDAAHDARSNLVDYLLRMERWEDALAEQALHERRLNAVEVPMRRAQALDALRRADEAAALWAEVFRRKPEAAARLPQEAARAMEWQARQPAADE